MMRCGFLALLTFGTGCQLLFTEQLANDASLGDGPRDANGDAPETLIDAPSAANFVFITKDTYNGNLGGIVGADAKCQASANRPQATFIAVLGYQNSSLYTALKVLDASRAWYRTDGELVADSPIEFTSGLRSPVIFDQNGQRIIDNVTIWTGFDNTGALQGNDCFAWSSAASSASGGFGQSDNRPIALGGSVSTCNLQRHLLCASIGATKPPVLRMPVANRMFVSGLVSLGPTDSGLAALDDICQNEANQAQLKRSDGTAAQFVALLSTSSQSAIVRSGLNPNVDYVRVDGARIGQLNAVPRTYIHLTANGGLADTIDVWTGGIPTTTSLLACFDWTSSTPTGTFGSNNRASNAAYDTMAGSCSSKKRVYCVEK
ncbi:MAG TPA: DUF1554 domain-containing protein [Kofleriaceae bacterium]|nr:DUF1554 domain-containing protein [Kofleriaceae bacterium]